MDDTPRVATFEELRRLNEVARERGYRHAASDEELAVLRPGWTVTGSPVVEQDGVLLVTWMIAPPDVLRDRIEHLLIEVESAEFAALPEIDRRRLSGTEGTDEGRAWPVFAVAALLLAAIVFAVVLAVGGDPVAVGGWIVAAGGVLVVLGIAYVVVQVCRGDHWDALDEFFASLEGLFAIGGGVGLAVVGGLVVLAGLLT